MDASNLLKPALARGQLQIIGATTLDEYRKHIEKDAALERRFQPVTVPEPTIEEAAEILRGLRDRYEDHHNLHYTDESLWAAAKLSTQYINDRYLPDKVLCQQPPASQQEKWPEECLPYREGTIFEGERIDVGKFGSPPSCQIFPSLLRMPCANMCAQQTTATIHTPLGNNSMKPCTKMFPSFL